MPHSSSNECHHCVDQPHDMSTVRCAHFNGRKIQVIFFEPPYWDSFAGYSVYGPGPDIAADCPDTRSEEEWEREENVMDFDMGELDSALVEFTRREETLIG